MTAAKNYVEIADHLHHGMEVLHSASPETLDLFQGLLGASISDGVVPAKIKEMLALAIVIAVRCDGCIAHHAKAVHAAGATRAEVVEVIGVAIVMGGGPAVVYGVEAPEAFDQFSSAKPAN